MLLINTGQNLKEEKDNDNMTFIYTNINWIKDDMVALIYTISSASVILFLSSFPLNYTMHQHLHFDPPSPTCTERGQGALKISGRFIQTRPYFHYQYPFSSSQCN